MVTVTKESPGQSRKDQDNSLGINPGNDSAIDEFGLEIPGVLAVARFDDLENSKLLNPPMTTVEMWLDDMIKAIIHTVTDLIEREST